VTKVALRSRAVLFLAACRPPSLAAQFALASETRIGEAVVIQERRRRLPGEATRPVNVGYSMLRDEVVRTGIGSAARYVMADSTNLSIGQGAFSRKGRR
jgi:hypothetical protein